MLPLSLGLAIGLVHMYPLYMDGREVYLELEEGVFRQGTMVVLEDLLKEDDG